VTTTLYSLGGVRAPVFEIWPVTDSWNKDQLFTLMVLLTFGENNVKCQLDATRQFIDVSLARHVSGAYAHHQDH